MKRTIVAVMVGLTLGAGAASAAGSHPHQSVYRKVSGPLSTQRIVLRHCGQGAEDRMAYLHETEYSSTRVVYSCLGNDITVILNK